MQPRQASRRRGAGSSKSAIDRQRHEEVCHRMRKQIERWADIQGKHVYRTLHLACRYNGFTGVYCAVRIRIIDQGGLHGLHPGGIALLVCKGNGTLREAHPFSCRTETHLEYRLSLPAGVRRGASSWGLFAPAVATRGGRAIKAKSAIKAWATAVGWPIASQKI